MPFPRTIHHAACTAALALFASTGASAQVAHLVMQSQPGDYIGQGRNYDLTYSPLTVPGDGAGGGTSSGTVGGLPDYVSFAFSQANRPPEELRNFALISFSTRELGTALVPGTYTDVERAAFAEPGHAGLEIGFQSRGCNTLTGNFTVTDFTYTMTAPDTFVVDTFAGSFEQHCDGDVPALYGTLTYYANGFSPVPEASTTVSFGLLLALGLGGAVVAARKKKATA